MRVVLLAAVASLVVGVVGVGVVAADIEGGTFTSEANNVRVTLPRDWRQSDQPTYPGIILRLFKTRPRGTILLAVDELAEVTASIEEPCRTRVAVGNEAPVAQPLEMQVACQQARRLAALGFEVGATKEAARPWFDYATEKRALRQGVAIFGDRVFTLVLAAETEAARAEHGRTFNKVLRSIRFLEEEEEPAPGAPPAPPADAGVDGAPK